MFMYPRTYLILLDICTILDRRDRFLSRWNIEHQTSMDELMPSYTCMHNIACFLLGMHRNTSWEFRCFSYLIYNSKYFPSLHNTIVVIFFPLTYRRKLFSTLRYVLPMKTDYIGQQSGNESWHLFLCVNASSGQPRCKSIVIEGEIGLRVIRCGFYEAAKAITADCSH